MLHSGHAIVAGPVIADLLFPCGSWPWTWTRELAFLAADNWREGTLTGNYTDGGYVREYNRTLEDPRTSLFGRWMMIASPPRPLRAETIQALAQRALQSESLGFEQDISRLIQGEEGLARLMRAVVSICDELDDSTRQLLLKELDETSRSVLDKLFVRRADRPDESPDDALKAVLVARWTNGGSDIVEKRLKAMALEAAPPLPSAAKPDAGTTK
jgi:hypothetical protein